jgi:predicted TIM-barrel fold metal-dependent hydrolase
MIAPTQNAPGRKAPGYRLVDADMHYYEPDDCFTRHLESRYADRALTVVKGKDGLGRVYFCGERVRYFSVSATDFTTAPGSLRAYLDHGEDRPVMEEQYLSPAKTHPEWVGDRAARLRQMDGQGVEAAIMLPTLGVSVEYELNRDLEAGYAALRAFNRWVEEDWGLGADGRIFGAAMISLTDRALAIEELERVIKAGARFFYLRAGPVPTDTPGRYRSPADPHYDAFWARVAEAGVMCILHIGNAGYAELFSQYWSEKGDVPSHRLTAFQHTLFQFDRSVCDVLAAMVLQNLFGRHPGLRVLSIENGSAWVNYLLKRMNKAQRAQWRVDSIGGRIEGKPSDIFRRHVWVCPFYEDDVIGLVGDLGPERVLLGSDYPHPEGVVAPLDFLNKLRGLPEAQVRRIARSNAAALLGLAA